MAFHAADAPRLVVLRAAVITAIARRRTVIGWTVGREPGPHASFPAIASRLTGLIACRRRLYESGAMLAAGSDAGVSRAKPHDVLRFAADDLAAAGMSPAEVLWAMTSRAAQACGLGHRKGRIAVGFDADILAIDGNPLEELAAIRRLRAVYAHGLPVSPAPDVPAGVAVH